MTRSGGVRKYGLLMLIASYTFVAAASQLTPQGNQEDQITVLEARLRENPNSSSLNNQLAILYAGVANWAKADEHLAIAMKLNPDDPLNYFDAALVSERRGIRDKEAEYLKKAIQTDHRNPVFHYKLSEVYRDIGDHAAAQSELSAARRILAGLPKVEAKGAVPRNAISHGIYYDQMGNSYPLIGIAKSDRKALNST